MSSFKFANDRTAIAAFAVGVVLTLALFVGLGQWITASEELQLDNDANRIAHLLQIRVDRQMVGVEHLAGYLQSNETQTDRGFQIMGRALMRADDALQAVEWIPVVSAGDRAAFEANAQDEFPGFHIREKRDGAMQRAGQRASYYPVHLVHPLIGNQKAVGFDLGSNPARLSALKRALSAQSSSATEPITLVQEGGSSAGFLVFRPVYDAGGAPIGFALIVARANTLVSAALDDTQFEMVPFVIRDVLSGADVSGRGTVSDRAVRTRFINLPGRRWEMTISPIVASNTPAAMARWLILLIGLCSTLGGTAWVHSVMMARQEIIRQVEEQTSELRASTEALRQARDAASEAGDQAATARDEAIHALKVREEFLAVISHELRTPLNGILGTARLLQETQLTDRQSELANACLTSGQGLLHLLNDILDTAKLDAGKIELEVMTFSPLDVLKDVAQLMRPSCEKKGLALVVDCRLAPDVGMKGDSGRIRQILLNFASNGIKFTASGSLTLRAEHEVDENGKHWLVVGCDDTGIGIPAGRVEALFDPFVQADSSTSRKYGGTGLGLTICRRFAHLMEGNVGAESTVGSGSTFWLRVPVEMTVLPKKQERVPKAAVKVTEHPLLVLVADDNTVNQMVAQGMLEAAGHVVHVVSDGQEAVQAVTEFEYDLVLMDVQMPIMDGREATIAIRKLGANKRDLPVIGLSADSSSGARQSCLDIGMNDYLTKPIRLDVLLEAVERWHPVV